MSEQLVDANAVAIGISLNTKLDDGRSIVMQTHVTRDAPVSEINSVLDKIAAAADRQHTKYRIKDLRLALEQHKKTLAQLMEDRDRLDRQSQEEWGRRNKRGDWTPEQLPQQARNDRANSETTQRRYRMEIAKIKAEIEESERILNPV